MREILFRGKRVDNNEWVEGFYVNVPEHYKQEMSGKSYIVSINNGLFMEVVHESVGEYTGLTDKNGKRIFEGDIIRAITVDTGTEEIAVVCFGNFIDENNDDEYIGFYIEFDDIKVTVAQLALEECKNRIEIIGNIHDNPELLGDEE